MIQWHLRLLAGGALAFLLTAVLVGCGTGPKDNDEYVSDDGEDAKPVKGSKPPKKPKPSTDDAKPTTGKKTAVAFGPGVLKGRVTFTGDKSKLTADLSTATQKLVAEMKTKPADLATCHDAASPSEKEQQEWRLGDGDGVEHVFVFLKPAPGTFFEVTEEHPGVKAKMGKDVILDQPHCAFIPHAVAVMPKFTDAKTKKSVAVQKMIVKNSAKIQHNTKFGDGGNDQSGGNPTINPDGQEVITNLEPSEHVVQFQCSIHPWMSAVGRVFNHPYFAITDKDGNFEIKNVPVGDVQVIAWHEKAGFLNAGGTIKGEKVTLTDKENKKDFAVKGP